MEAFSIENFTCGMPFLRSNREFMGGIVLFYGQIGKENPYDPAKNGIVLYVFKLPFSIDAGIGYYCGCVYCHLERADAIIGIWLELF